MLKAIRNIIRHLKDQQTCFDTEFESLEDLLCQVYLEQELYGEDIVEQITSILINDLAVKQTDN